MRTDSPSWQHARSSAETDPARLLAEPLAPAGRRWARIFSLAIAVDFILILGLFGHRIGARDWDQFLVFHELQYWNANLFHGDKQWCPLMCSGISMASEPQVPVLSLSMLLGYATDPFWGIRLAKASYLILGWIGAFLYAGLVFPHRLQRALAASLFIGNGFFVCRIALGHVDFLPFLILPGVLYVLHRGVEWMRAPRSWEGAVRLGLAVLGVAAALSVAMDGSPVAILHELFWIGLYGAALSLVTRSFAPVGILGMAGLLAAVLDAGYLWPMVAGQGAAPRRVADSFTHPLALPWYMLVPSWGRFFLTANGKGHEFSVFIGPVLAVLIWRFRKPLLRVMPRSLSLPLLVVALASVWLGMGSLQLVHVPRWLSPFDLLRPLPGFRSIGVTGRYWGFLALPLSLLGAGALWSFLATRPGRLKTVLWVGLALVTQLGAQTTALLAQHIRGYSYHPVDWKAVASEGRPVEFILSGSRFQGELITPARAVIDCYDEDDIPRADVAAGTGLVRSVQVSEGSGLEGIGVFGRFETWSRIRIQTDSPGDDLSATAPGSTVEVQLNQAYHPGWTAPRGRLLAGPGKLLTLQCEASVLRRGPVDLQFHDPVSSLGWEVSQLAWASWCGALAGLLATGAILRRRRETSGLPAGLAPVEPVAQSEARKDPTSVVEESSSAAMKNKTLRS